MRTSTNQGGADDASLLVEHLLRRAFARRNRRKQFLSTQIRAGDRFANCRYTRHATSLPAAARPSHLRRSERLMLFRGGGDDAALAVDDEARVPPVPTSIQNVDRASRQRALPAQDMQESLSHFVGHEEE